MWQHLGAISKHDSGAEESNQDVVKTNLGNKRNLSSLLLAFRSFSCVVRSFRRVDSWASHAQIVENLQ